MKPTVARLTALGTAALCVSMFVGAGTAFAHVDADPVAVQAGTSATVGFTVLHGCESSPTIELDFKIPSGVTDIKPVDKAGWTGAVSGETVTFTGGPLAADVEETFSMTFTAPAAAGTIRFPLIQKCQVGELDWIEIAAEGQAEPEHPAPALNVTVGPPTAEELTPVPDATDAPAPTGSDVSSSGTETAVPVTVTAPAPAKSSDSSHTGLIVGIVAAAVVVLGGGAALNFRRRNPKA